MQPTSDGSHASCAEAKKPFPLICAGHPAQGAEGRKEGQRLKGEKTQQQGKGSEVYSPLGESPGLGGGSEADEKHKGRGSLVWIRCSGSRMAEEALHQHMADHLCCLRCCCCWFCQQLYLRIKNKVRRRGEARMQGLPSCHLLTPARLQPGKPLKSD